MLNESSYSNWLLIAVEKGLFEYKINEISDTVSDGDLLICPPNTLLYRNMLSPTSFHFIKLQWKNEYGDIIEDPSIPIGKIKISNKDRLLTDLTLLQQVNKQELNLNLILSNHLLTDIWYIYKTESQREEHNNKPTDSLMNTVIEYINKNAYNKLCLKELSKEIGLSPVQLTRRFKSAFQVTPINYVTSMRIEKAKQLLLETNLKLSDIAKCLGYENEFYLSRIFKENTNMTPTVYRKNYKI